MWYWLCCPILGLQPLSLVLGSPWATQWPPMIGLSREVPYLASAARVAGALHQLNTESNRGQVGTESSAKLQRVLAGHPRWPPIPRDHGYGIIYLGQGSLQTQNSQRTQAAVCLRRSGTIRSAETAALTAAMASVAPGDRGRGHGGGSSLRAASSSARSSARRATRRCWRCPRASNTSAARKVHGTTATYQASNGAAPADGPGGRRLRAGRSLFESANAGQRRSPLPWRAPGTLDYDGKNIGLRGIGRAVHSAVDGALYRILSFGHLAHKICLGGARSSTSDVVTRGRHGLSALGGPHASMAGGANCPHTRESSSAGGRCGPTKRRRNKPSSKHFLRCLTRRCPPRT